MNRVLPILFNTEMVRAILDGRKTVTRRICKEGNDFTVPDMSFYDADRRTYAVHNYANKDHTDKLSLAERICPICPEDILYVRETFRPLSKHPAAGFDYAANWSTKYFENSRKPNACNNGKWKPSIHMPKKAARIWLKVADVRVEKLQNMNTGDFLSEGVIIRPEAYNDPENAYQQAKKEFIHIWDSTIKKSEIDQYGWTANPWTWVIEFEQCEKPEEEG